MKNLSRRSALATLGAALAAPSRAHTVQEFTNEFYAKEQYFEAFDKPTPDFILQDEAGNLLGSADFVGKVIVLHFIYTSCTDVCPLHAEKVAEVQAMINQTPMKGMVQFLSITTDPANDTPEVLAQYGPQHGLDAVNWRFLTVASGQREDATRSLAEAFGHRFRVESDGTLTHGVVTHIVGKFGRWQGNFHGLKFQPVNMVMFVNALTNDFDDPEPGFWDKVWRWF